MDHVLQRALHRVLVQVLGRLQRGLVLRLALGALVQLFVLVATQLQARGADVHDLGVLGVELHLARGHDGVAEGLEDVHLHRRMIGLREVKCSPAL